VIGTLLQAYTTVTWAGYNLSAFDDGAGGKQVLAQNISVSLNKADSAPTLSFDIAPNPIGFELFQQIKSSALSAPITVTVGYLNGSSVTWQFKFAGMSLTTGHDPALSIKAVSAIKGCWTDNKISYTLEDPISLAEFPEFLKTKCGDCAKDLSFSFSGQAAIDAAQIMINTSQIKRTPHTILMNALRPHGIDMQIGDNAFSGEVVLSYSPAMEGELAEDLPADAGTTESKPGQRRFFIIGPGLMENITRSQNFQEGQTATKRNSSKLATPSNETEQSEVVQPDSAPQQSSASQTLDSGVLGKPSLSKDESGIVRPGANDIKARQAFSSQLTTKCDLNVMMVPYMVGIKPRDILVIPSLKGPGDYLEDWEVDSVTYDQDSTGGIFLSLKGSRTFTGEQPMIDGATQSKVRSTVSSLTTPESWSAFYWSGGQAGKATLQLAN